MKYISFAIPCYNSEAYMAQAIESILPGGEDVEILIVNDGSKDRTAEIGKEYEEKYPGIVKLINKENGGHGDAVNAGLSHASGKYFKVVDSDDWVDRISLMKILNVLKNFEEEEQEVDMLIANYVYEKVGMEHKKVIRYDNVLPENQILKWDEIGQFRIGQYIFDAFRYLSYRYVEALSVDFAKAYILCRQYLCILPTSTCTDIVLYECRFLPLFYWKRRSVCQ